jgi:hypothetical protein
MSTVNERWNEYHGRTPAEDKDTVRDGECYFCGERTTNFERGNANDPGDCGDWVCEACWHSRLIAANTNRRSEY